MELTYRTRRRLKQGILTGLGIVLALVLLWTCWVIWVERYVVYTRDGAVIDFSLATQDPGWGQTATPPAPKQPIPIYYQEGDHLEGLDTALRQMKGYYITSDMLMEGNTETIRAAVAALPVGSTVMMEVKSIKGNFYYSSGITDAPLATNVDVDAVDAFIDDMLSRNLYVVACVPAFRDRSFALEHTNIGIPFVGGDGALWLDSSNCYWLDPAKNRTMDYLTKIATELRQKGFNEVLFTDFCIPDSDQVDYPGDRAGIIQNVAQTLVETCAKNNFAVSFLATGSTVRPVEGRSRLYLTGVEADGVDTAIAGYGMENPAAGMVFLTDSFDPRYDAYSVLRPLNLGNAH